jgi:hypothetical protein
MKKSGYSYAYYKSLIAQGYTSKEAKEIACDYLPEEDDDKSCIEEDYTEDIFNEGHRHYYMSEPDYQKKNREEWRKARKRKKQNDRWCNSGIKRQ